MTAHDRASLRAEHASQRPMVEAVTRAWRGALAQHPAAVFALAGLVIALCAGAIFNRVTSPWSSLPDNDYWGNINGLITDDGVRLTLENLFLHNNEHIVVIPKLVYAANYVLTSGSNIGLLIYSLMLGALCTAILLYLAVPLFRDTPIRLLLCAVLFPLAMFSAKLSHSYFLGMSGTIWLTADLFVILGAAAIARAVTEQSAPWLFSALLAALTGVLSYSTAAYSLLVLLITCIAFVLVPRLRGIMSWVIPAGIGSAALGVFMLGAAYRNPYHPTWRFDLVELAHFVLLYLGTALAEGHLRWVAGLAMLAAGAVAIFRLVIEQRTTEMLGWIILFFYAPFNGLMTGIGRLDLGSETASSSRYQAVTAISFIAAVTLALAALPKGTVSRRAGLVRGAVIVALIAVVVVLATNRAFVREHVARNQVKAIAEIAMRHNIPGEQHLRIVAGAAANLGNLIPVMRAARHAPFHWQSACEKLLGTRLPEASGPAAGTVEFLSDYPVWRSNARALELTGIAEQGGLEAECIVIVDGNRTVIGAGASIAKRPDIERAKGVRLLGAIGWKAVASIPQLAPICALALFPDDFDNDGPWEPLDNCQESPEIAAAPPTAEDARELPTGP